jgi:hypothetical protein
MRHRLAGAWIGVFASVAAIAGCAAGPPDGGETGVSLRQTRQAYYDGINGLMSINGLNPVNGLGPLNGLSPFNGLMSVNGFNSVNGLSSVNGINAINGLVSFKGLATMNGLPVDCSGGKVPGTSCTGAPDGFMSATSGLMRSGYEPPAVYMVRCALPAGDQITIKDYTGSLVTLYGELGIAPAWKTGPLDVNGMEAISSCLMALTNGTGTHVHIEMNSSQTAPRGTSQVNVLGKHSTSPSNWFKYQEAVFYGNLFTSPPTGMYCVGKDYVGILALPGSSNNAVTARACSGYGIGNCPYKNMGTCENLVTGGISLATSEIDAIANGSNPTNGGCAANAFNCQITGNGACNWIGGGGSTPNPSGTNYVDESSCTTSTKTVDSASASCGKDLLGNTTCANTWNNAIYTYRLDVTLDKINAL